MRIPAYQAWQTMAVLPERQESVRLNADRALKSKDRYVEAVRGHIPWAMLAVIHYREASFDFDRQLYNGEPWNRRTRLIPKGMGPWLSWEQAAEQLVRETWAARDWTVTDVLNALERHNGLGYKHRRVMSPYVWAGTNHGIGCGLFTSDGHYDAVAEDPRVGCAPLLAYLLGIGEVEFAPEPVRRPVA